MITVQEGVPAADDLYDLVADAQSDPFLSLLTVAPKLDSLWELRNITARQWHSMATALLRLHW